MEISGVFPPLSRTDTFLTLPPLSKDDEKSITARPVENSKVPFGKRIEFLLEEREDVKRRSDVVLDSF